MPLVAALAAVLAAVSLLSFLGGLYWVFDLVAAFRPQLSLVLLPLVGILALSKWRRTALATGAVAVLNLAVLAPMFLPGQQSDTAELRILSFNVLARNENFAEVVEFIRQAEADLVVLHEASRPWVEALAAADLDYTMSVNRHPNDIYSSLVLAPADASVESFGFRPRDPRAVAIELEAGISVLAIHPLSPYSAERASIRDEQLLWARDWILDQVGPVIVTGDFNATPYSYSYRNLRAATGLHDSIRGFGLELSYPAEASPIFQVAIDHLLYSDGLEIVDRRLGPAMGSDHYPLTVDLALQS